MNQEELRQAIEAPASRLGVQFQDGLIDIILSDVGQEPGNLPLLQFCLTQLWEKQSNKMLSLVDYKSIGQVHGALTYHATAIYDQLSAYEQTQLSHILKQLVKLSTSAEATRRVAMRDNFSDEHWKMVQMLADESHRLVVINSASEQETVEVVHEALITHWEHLKHWVDEDRQFLVWRDNFRVLMTSWVNNGRQNTELLRGNTLNLAESWLDARTESFVETEREFIEQSSSEQQAEEEKALKQAQAIAMRNTVITLISIAAIMVLGFMGMRLNDELENSKSLLKLALQNESRSLTNMSVQSTDSGDALLGVLLAIEALPDTRLEKKRPYLPNAENALYYALQNPIPSQILTGHEDLIYSASFSPDDASIVTVSGDRTARIWQVGNSESVTSLQLENDVNSASFSSDGTRILTTSDNGAEDSSIMVWQADTGQPIAEIRLNNFRFEYFSPDGTRIVTLLEDGTAQLWHAGTGQALVTLKHDAAVNSASFTPDGKRIVTASEDGTAKVWDTVTGQSLATLQHDSRVSRASFSPDGTLIVTQPWDKTAKIWQVDTGQVLTTLLHDDHVYSASFSPDGSRILTVTLSTSTARLWQIEKEHPLATVKLYNKMYIASFSPDSKRIIALVGNNAVQVLRADNGQLLATLQHDKDVTSASFNSDGTSIITTFHKTARVWPSGTGQALMTLQHDKEVYSASFSPDGTLIVTSSKAFKFAIAPHADIVQIWEADSGQVLRTLQHEDGVYLPSFSPDGKSILTLSLGNTIRIWQVDTGQIQSSFQHPYEVISASFSPDGTSILVASDDGVVRVLQVGTGQIQSTFQHPFEVISASFSPDGTRIITISADGVAWIWQVQTGQILAKLRNDDNGFIDGSFSPDGTRIVTATANGTIQIWVVGTWQTLKTFRDDDSASSASFSPDSNHIVTVARKSTRVRRVNPELLLATLNHDRWVTSATFSPDGKRVITASKDKTVQVWGLIIFPTTQSVIEYAMSILPITSTNE